MIHDFYLQCALALGSKWWKIKKSLRPQEVCNLMGPLALIAMRRLESDWVVAESVDSAAGLKGTWWSWFQAARSVFWLRPDMCVQTGAPERRGCFTGTWHQAFVLAEFCYVCCVSFSAFPDFSLSLPSRLLSPVFKCYMSLLWNYFESVCCQWYNCLMFYEGMAFDLLYAYIDCTFFCFYRYITFVKWAFVRYL